MRFPGWQAGIMGLVTFVDLSVKRLHPAFPMTFRAATALVGGYVLAASVAAVSARLLPIVRVEATAWSMNLSFLLYASVALWAFAEPRLKVVTLWIWGVALLAVGASLLLGVRP